MQFITIFINVFATLVNTFVLERRMSISFEKNDILTFSLIVLIIIILILFIIFRRVKWVFAILFTSISAVYLSIGLAGFINFEITAVSANFLSLMFVLSISMNVHILSLIHI